MMTGMLKIADILWEPLGMLVLGAVLVALSGLVRWGVVRVWKPGARRPRR